MSFQQHDIVETNLAAYTKELAQKLADGWAINKTCPGEVIGLYGGTFTVSLYRDADTVRKAKETAAAIADIARPDRATILAKARAARAEKAGKAGKSEA
jgi:hypothetical protein